MGKIVVPAKIENIFDLYETNKGTMLLENVRACEVPDALVDTGCTYLGLPSRFIHQLGLKLFTTRQARTPTGPAPMKVYDAVRLTVQGRFCLAEVSEVDDTCPVLIGQLPLEALDFVIDPKGQRLIGNPDHGGEHMFDLL